MKNELAAVVLTAKYVGANADWLRLAVPSTPSRTVGA
jgi:hypothetical protein